MFAPDFTYVDTIEEAADRINKPHEDYPKRVDSTIELIRDVGIMLDAYCAAPVISEFLIKQVHSEIMWDLPEKERGCYRKIYVEIGGARLGWEKLLDTMNRLHPYYLYHNEHAENEYLLKDWFIRFEMIHPFTDGNGRVGGIILAAMSTYVKLLGFLIHDS